MNRRQLLLSTAAATMGLTLTRWPFAMAMEASMKPRKFLFFSKSSGYEHAVIKLKDGKSFVQGILPDLGAKLGMEFTFSKDGSLFSPDYCAQFDAFVFYTTGDLLSAGKDGNPPMTHAGKTAFLDAINGGKGFVGIHSATDTFHTGETADHEPVSRISRYHNLGDKADPYTRMIGAEFIVHGAQQAATMRVIDKKFPGFEGYNDNFKLNEEWYSLIDFSKDLHVLLVQQTEGMNGYPYQRPAYPATWARQHGKGRVFYTSMGHRQDVWTNPLFQSILLGGLNWACGNVGADVTPNVETICPDCWKFPAPPPPTTAKTK